MKKYINLEDMTNTNCSNVLDVIQKNGMISRREITDETGLSWGGMTKIVNKLLENGYIVEQKQKSTAQSGRTPSVISVNTQTNFVIGLDINKTGLKALVMNLSGEILKEYKAPVPEGGKEKMLEGIMAFVDVIFRDFKREDIITIGVAMQGIVNAKTGVSVKFPDAADWNNVPLGDILRERFDVNVFVEHDPDCMLYPFLKNKAENFLLLRIDKSIGMAVSVKNKILKDEGILEVAHTVAVPGGKACVCGLRGCAEAYVAPCIENGVPDEKAIAEFVPVLAVIMKNMTAVFHADTVILTGELMKYRALFADALADALRSVRCEAETVFSDDDNAAVYGAALLAVRKSINSLSI